MADKQITITIVGDASKAASAFQTAGSAAGTFDTKIEGLGSKVGNFGSVMSGVLAAGAVQKVGSFLIDGAKGAAEDAASMGKLRTAVENSGSSYETYSTAIDDTIKKSQALGFTDGETTDALALLTQETGSTEDAMARLHTAQDLARGTGMTLEQASKLLGKASDENTGILKKYGLAVEDGATAQDLMNEVDARFGGQAATYAESDAGKWSIASQQMGEVQETIGGALIPVFSLLATLVLEFSQVLQTQLIPAITTVVSTIWTFIEPVAQLVEQYLTPLLVGLGAIAAIIIASFIPALLAWVSAMIPVVAEHIALAAAAVVAYAPIIAALLAVGIAVALVYEAWSTNFLGIQDITQAVIDFIKPYILDAVAAIQTVFETVMPIIQTVVETVFGVIKTVIETDIAAVQSIFETAMPIIQSIFETVFPIIQAVVETVFGVIIDIITTDMAAAQSIFETVWPIVQGVVEVAMAAIQSAVELGTAAVNTAVDLVMGPGGTVLGLVTDGAAAALSAIDAVFGVAGTILSAVTDGVAAVFDAFDPVLGAAGTVVGSAKDGAAAVYDGIDAVLGVGGTLVGAVTDGIAAVVDAITGPLEDIVGTIGDIASDLYDAGYDMISQIAQGIRDAVSTVLQPAIDFVGGVLGSIDVPFHSPPEEAGYEIGYEYGAGMAAGINKSLPLVADAVGGLGGVMATGSPPAGSGDTGTIPYSPHESADKFLYCNGTTAVFENHSETNHPTCGGSSALAGTGNLGGSGSLGSGGASRAMAVSPTSGTIIQNTGPPTEPDSLGRLPGNPCWGKPAGCEAAQGVGGGMVSTPPIASGGSMEGHWSGDVAYSRVTSTYLNPRTGLHQFGGIPAGQGGLGDVWLDGRIVGMLLGWRNRRDAFSLRDPAGACK